MGMEAGGVVTIRLQGSDHAGKPLAALHGGILEKFLDGRVSIGRERCIPHSRQCSGSKVASTTSPTPASLINFADAFGLA